MTSGAKGIGQELQNHALANGEKIARMKGIVMSTYPQAILAHIECFFLFFYERFEELPWHGLRIIHQGVLP
jgi:hypothetical protein